MTKDDDLARIAGTAALAGLGAALLVFAAVHLLTWLAIPADKAPLVARIDQAFRDGVFAADRQDWFSNTEHDCLGLSSLVSPYPSRAGEALFPKTAADYCPGLHALITGGPLSEPPSYYHRYLHGWRLYDLLLLKVTSVAGARALLFWTGIAALAGTVAVAVARLRGAALAAGGLAPARRDLALATTALAFLVLHGWDQFGRQVGHGLWSLALFLLLLGVTLRPRLGALADPRLALAAGAWGAAMAHLDFLTGALPLGFALLLALVALTRPPDGPGFWRAPALAGAAYLSAFAACFALKLALVAAVFGAEPLRDFAAQLGARAGGRYQDELDMASFGRRGQAVADAATYSLATLRFFLHRLASDMRSIGWGASETATAVVVGSLGLLAASAGGLWARWRGTAPARLLAALLLAALVVPAWYAVFLQHAIVHSRFMVRLLTWPVAIGWVLAGLLLLDLLAARRRAMVREAT